MISRLDVEVENELLILEHIHSAVNVADHMTKLLDRTLFYHHVDHLMGHVPSVYSPCYKKYSAIPNTTIDDLRVALEDLVIAPEHAAAAKCSVDYYPWVEVVGMDVLYQSNLFGRHWIEGGVSVYVVSIRVVVTILSPSSSVHPWEAGD
jgi:hypothetical protein